jgi:membrane protein YqaA with SNARE-associated domain
MLRKLYDAVLRLAGSRHAVPALAVISFAESSVFPIPPDVMLMPMVVARPERAFIYAGIATLGSVAGAFLGYAIGYFLTGFGESIFRLFGHAGDLAVYGRWFDQNGLYVILLKGLTPIPFKLVTIAAGFAKFNLAKFFIACAVTRGARFFIEAALIKKFGPAIMPVVEKRLTLFFVGFLVLLVGGFVALKVLA